MFETTTTDSGSTIVNVSFWQCVKAGMGITIGASLVWFVSIVITWGVGLSALAAIGTLLKHR